MAFRIQGLSRQSFSSLLHQPESVLEHHGARRLISLRAFDANHLMIDADIAQGGALPEIIERTFDNQSVAYLHAHYAKWGCYAARVDRA